jgi:tetratricopeptide (TPR) repeat protein
LAAARGTRAYLPVTVVLTLLLLWSGAGWAQCRNSSQPQKQIAARIEQAYRQHDWAQVIRLAESIAPRPADFNFEYGMALAHLRRWQQARAALLAGAKECPAQKRFPIELAGVAFEEKKRPEAAHWLRKGLSIDPRDAYANNFLGTDYYLMGNLDAALRYWNRVQRPYLDGLDFDPHLQVHRLLLDRAFAFSPAAVMTEAQYETTEARLHGLGIFPTYNISFEARSDGHFDAVFAARELDGFGATRLQALVSTFSGAIYETLYPRYFNLRRRAMNFDSLLRWDRQKRRAWLALSAPIREFPQWRWQISTDARDENWAIQRSFTGYAPVLGAFNLKQEEAMASLRAIASGRLQWSVAGDVSHRTFHDVVYGSALTPQLIAPGYELKSLVGVDYEALHLPERRLTLATSANGILGRTWAHGEGLFEELQGSALMHWFPQAEGDNYEVQQQVRAGKIFGAEPFDELYLLGMERDTDLWMRGHIGTRDGRKGSSPVGDAYFLSNSDLFKRIYSNGLLQVQLGTFLDIGRMGAPTVGLSTQEWLFDTGIEAKLTVLGTSVVLSYGRDLRSGNNAFYGTVAH